MKECQICQYASEGDEVRAMTVPDPFKDHGYFDPVPLKTFLICDGCLLEVLGHARKMAVLARDSLSSRLEDYIEGDD